MLDAGTGEGNFDYRGFVCLVVAWNKFMAQASAVVMLAVVR